MNFNSSHQPPIDISHLQKSVKRTDIIHILSVDPKKLTVAQKKQAKTLGLWFPEMAPLFERAKRSLPMYGYNIDKLLESGQYHGMSELELLALKKSAINKVCHLKNKGKKDGENSPNEDLGSIPTLRLS